MRGSIVIWILALAVTVLAASCAKKTSTETAQSFPNDSLIASNPVETPQGSLKPQVPYEPAPERPEPPPTRATRTPRPQPRTHHTTNPPPTPVPTASNPMPAAPAEPPGLNVEWGSYLHVTFNDAITSETAKVGDEWTASLKDPVYVKDRVALPAGSVVHGAVKDVKPAERGDRAMLALEVTSVDVNGRNMSLSATADPIIADSPRARNIGAVAGGAGAGALIGRALGGTKGTLIGGLLGGAAAGGAVAKSKGYQVVIKPGTTLTFTVAHDTVVRP